MSHLDLASQLIRRHEGLRLTVYDDKTGMSLRKGDVLVGRATIGYGRLLDIGRGLSREEAEYLLANDLTIAETVAQQFAGRSCWNQLSAERKAVLIDMAHNLGSARLRGFVMFHTALQVEDYETAAAEMLASLWAEQVGDRALTLAAMMKSGEWPAAEVA